MTARQDLAAWLQLTLAPGLGGDTQRKLLAAFGLPDAILAAGRSALRSVIGHKADALLDFDPGEAVDRTQAWLEQPHHHFITLADREYPPALLEIPDPPTVLYVRGQAALLASRGLAIVGSRNATPQGLRTAEDFARTLAGHGLCIVSGLALGVDGAAHAGALAAPGPTVAVIGTGADRLYPARHRDLALAIVEHGAIVSEFPLGTPALAANFPRRNRIIAGLSRGVLVVEAAVESGSLITARLAAEQGREVFAIPGSIHSPLARGCHRLIKQGAKLVESAADILEELGTCTAPRAAASPAPAIGAGSSPAVDDPVQAELLHHLAQGPLTADELVALAGLATEQLLAALLELELAGRIAALPGQRYQRLH